MTCLRKQAFIFSGKCLLVSTIELLPQTQELLTDKILGRQDIEATIRLLLKGEYMRRLSQYHRRNYEKEMMM